VEWYTLVHLSGDFIGGDGEWDAILKLRVGFFAQRKISSRLLLVISLEDRLFRV